MLESKGTDRSIRFELSMENNLTLKTYMAVMAERDAAIRERNVAIEERRQALAERDMAMSQRDSALAERNSALEERDNALNALQFRESPTNDYNPNPDSQELDYMYNDHQQQQQQLQLDDTPLSAEPYTTTKTRKGKQAKEKGGTRSKKKGTKRGCEEIINNQVTNESTSDIWDSVDFGDDGDDLEQHFAAWNENTTTTRLKEELGGAGGGYDDESAALAVPVCSCSGVQQPCYKLGNGGWQSSCCTTPVPMYHLHQPNKRQAAGVVGRKISGGAFAKLMNRLVEEGHDPYISVDLKDHWDQHETPK